MTQNISDRIKIERTKIGLSVNELAEILKRSSSSQLKIESGTRRPSVNYLLKLAALGMDIGYIITGERQINIPLLWNNEQIPANTETGFQRLKAEREKLNLTAKEFGALGGIGQSTQFNYEKGSSGPKFDYLIKLYQAGIDVHYIITGKRLAPNLTAHALLTAFFNADQQVQESVCKTLNIENSNHTD